MAYCSSWLPGFRHPNKPLILGKIFNYPSLKTRSLLGGSSWAHTNHWWFLKTKAESVTLWEHLADLRIDRFSMLVTRVCSAVHAFLLLSHVKGIRIIAGFPEHPKGHVRTLLPPVLLPVMQVQDTRLGESFVELFCFLPQWWWNGSRWGWEWGRQWAPHTPPTHMLDSTAEPACQWKPLAQRLEPVASFTSRWKKEPGTVLWAKSATVCLLVLPWPPCSACSASTEQDRPCPTSLQSKCQSRDNRWIETPSCYLLLEAVEIFTTSYLGYSGLVAELQLKAAPVSLVSHKEPGVTRDRVFTQRPFYIWWLSGELVKRDQSCCVRVCLPVVAVPDHICGVTDPHAPNPCFIWPMDQCLPRDPACKPALCYFSSPQDQKVKHRWSWASGLQ